MFSTVLGQAEEGCRFSNMPLVMGWGLVPSLEPGVVSVEALANRIWQKLRCATRDSLHTLSLGTQSLLTARPRPA